jgi:membrane protease YdiL (CAAX protease family)
MRRPKLTTHNSSRLTENDWLLIAICAALVIASIAIVIRYFHAAFPQAAIDFKVDRNSSIPIAERFLASRRLDVRGMKHAARFDSNETARIFLERELGLEAANEVLSRDVQVWAWHHRWFRPLVEEEISVNVSPAGAIIGFNQHIPEERAAPPPSVAPPVDFLTGIGVDVSDLELVDTSERRLPKRVQRIFTWESASIRPAGAQYRHTVTVDGNLVTSYQQSLKVPDAWVRSYRELRSKNAAAGSVDLIFNVALMIGAVVIFIIRLRRGDLPLRFLIGIGIASVILVGGVAVNELPAQLAFYDTTASYPAFIGQLAFGAAMQSVGTAMLLIVICGAGEVLYRERLPKQLAMPRIWTAKALASKRVFLSLILGYALVPMFMAYQVVFYLAARKAGAWSPAEVPYDDMLNSALPWVAVLFAGFFPAFSEEFLSRAFAIPFIQRFAHSRWFAIVLAGFIWGFGHSTYPNQPFWIRGVEVGVVGVIAGFLMERFGLLPLLIWHYTIDAVYTATLLFASGNTYYIVSAALASLLFAIPLLVSMALYLRNRGFLPDEELSNAAMPPPAPIEISDETTPVLRAELPLAEAAGAPQRRAAIACIALIIAAAIAIAFRPSSPDDAIDYRITAERAKEIARDHVGRVEHAYVIAAPADGFRWWNAQSGREEGGAPGDFDEIAATWLVHQGLSIDALIDVFRTRLEAATWMVRFFTPMQKEELFVEVDPRTARVVGFHKYQEERNAAMSLTQSEAAVLARGVFGKYGLDANAFELKETLSFQQPARRDWLFHFDERTPIAARGFRRVTVRVAGNQVTQFNKTIRVPESVYREATTETLLNVVLYVLKIAGLVTLLALVISGMVFATRAHGLPWKRPLRWTLILSIIPIFGFIARLQSMLYGYSTTIAWETFRVSLITAFVRDIGLQAGIMFLALAGLEAAVPYAMRVPTREGRARFGKSAVVAALTAIAILVLCDVAMRFVAHAVPSSAAVVFSAPQEVATPLPALVEGGQALFGAIVFAGAMALFTAALPGKHAASLVIAAIFCAALDPLASPQQMPLMLVRALLLGVLIWCVACYVLGSNPLAWPLTVFVGATLQAAAVLLQNQRPDLLANGIALIVFAIVALAWAWRGTREPGSTISVLEGRT